MIDQEFFKQAAIAAMQAMIQARATTEASETASGEDFDSGEIFSTSIHCGVGAPIGLLDEKDVHYTWGKVIAEEAFEIAEYMALELEARLGVLDV